MKSTNHAALSDFAIANLMTSGVAPHISAVSCNKISFAYPHADQLAIDCLSLDVRQGEIASVCGANGSGKTTLMKLLAGMLTPRSGTITVCGRKLDKKGRSEAFRHVGLLFEDPNDQLFCTHVKEDVAYGPRNLGLDEDEVKKRVIIALDQAEAGHLYERPIHALSYGEMRRVALAGLIAMRPPLLVLDEPTAGLDPASAEHLGSLIKRLNKKYGYTVLVVTHDMAWAAKIARRMVIMNSGRILADGSIRSVLVKEAILEKSRLRPPELAQLFKTLYRKLERDHRTLPLNIEEAIKELEPLLNPD
jgi:cobalt/nickel transport system ATP-binding protein